MYISIYIYIYLYIYILYIHIDVYRLASFLSRLCMTKLLQSCASLDFP